MKHAKAALPLALAMLLAPACGGPNEQNAKVRATPTALAAQWDTATTQTDADLTGTIEVPPLAERTSLTVKIDGVLLTEIPDGCLPSTTLQARSRLSTAHDQLQCVLDASDEGRTLRITARVRYPEGGKITGDVHLPESAGKAADVTFAPAQIAASEKRETTSLRLISSPDFLNADVADLAEGPSLWTPERSENAINADYQGSLDAILDDWKSLDPAGVLVAGDLVDGHWGRDQYDTGNFGPVETQTQREAALRLAADTFYPAWIERFTSRGLLAFPAIGDHEYGDNEWPKSKRALAPAFKNAFADYFTRKDAGGNLFPNHPKGPARFTAYAGRPTPDVEIITIDVFDITPAHDKVGLDPQQLKWLEGVLAKAKSDGVKWIVVQGHVPVLWPVRLRGSSGLHYPGAEDSKLWRLFRQYDVDLYLSGEVHDVTLRQEGGVTQITHGGLFQFGLTNYLLMDFYDDHLDLFLRDYSIEHGEAKDGSRLWETTKGGMPKVLRVGGKPFTIGTAKLSPDELESTSGILDPYEK